MKLLGAVYALLGGRRHASGPVSALGRDPRKSPNALRPASSVPVSVLEVLSTLPWVHRLDGTRECTGCANDGEPGYCQGPNPADEQDDPAGIYCYCGHFLALAIELEPADPYGWHCAGEDAEHWPGTEGTLLAECGYCGWEPSFAEVVDLLLDGRVVPSELADYFGEDRAAELVSAAILRKETGLDVDDPALVVYSR